MAKFDIPKFRWLFQDEDGHVWFCINEPSDKDEDWMSCGGMYFHVIEGKENPNWRDTLIDLDVDDYEFEDGILRRIENATTKN